jgi:hypothetical protein
MRRWKLVVVLVLGVLYMLACQEQAKKQAAEAKVNSPVAGVWYLQAVSADRPIAGDVDVRFEFGAHGAATYERRTDGPEEPMLFDLRYNVSESIISIDSNSEDPGIPRITGKISLADDGQTLRIKTHSDEQWVLTREARPGGALESARQSDQIESKADPMLVRVQHLAYAVARYEQVFGDRPSQLMDLVDAGLVSVERLTPSGTAEELPQRYPRMTAAERSNWLSAHSAFALVDAEGVREGRSRVVVTSLPRDNRSPVVLGMHNGAVQNKTPTQAARQIASQGGSLPERWPSSGLSADAAAGVEPLSD